ncbi:MAG: hypothetical protein IPP99_02325 [Chitinophagaceae bacterium]|nr:hypothetical protein [Chitinophagaceae bacterium]
MEKYYEIISVAENDLDSAEGMLDGYVKETATMVKDIKGMPALKVTPV